MSHHPYLAHYTWVTLALRGSSHTHALPLGALAHTEPEHHPSLAPEPYSAKPALAPV